VSTNFLKVKNNALSSLASGITSSATSLSVIAGEGSRFPSEYPFHVSIDDEILECSSRSTDTLTVSRKAESTSAAAHSAGAPVALTISAQVITDLQDGKARTSTVVVAASDSSTNSKLGADYVCDGTADDVEIQAAISALAVGRTWIETVKCIGSFSTAALLSLPSYTRLDLTEAIITLANASDCTVIVNSDTVGGNTQIEVIGGVIEGNQANQTGNRSGIYFSNITNSRIEKVYVHDTKFMGIYFSIATNCEIVNCTTNTTTSNGITFELSSTCKIIGCTSISSTTTGQLITDSTDCTISSGYAESCLNGFRIAGTGVIDCRRNAITNCISLSNSESGFKIRPISDTPVLDDEAISNCISSGNTAHGFHLESCNKIALSNLIAYGNTLHGIYVSLGSSVAIENCVTHNNAHGILLEGCNYSSIIGCTSFANASRGIYAYLVTDTYTNITINGNIVYNNAAEGIFLRAINYAQVIGNQSFDDQGIPTQTYGIRCWTVDYAVIENNITYGNVTAQILPAGANSLTRSNIGYVTENSGTATLLNANTSIVVAHGLAATPTRIQITPRENPTNAVTFWWVDTVGAMNFTINVDADPGASNLDFDWHAQVGEG